MGKRYIFILLMAWATTAFSQTADARLSELDAYLQKQGGHVMTDYIRNIFAQVSKVASESYRFEYHKNGVDTIKYELVFRNDDINQDAIWDFARFHVIDGKAEYHHGHRMTDLSLSEQPDMKRMGQPNPRLQLLEDYLRKKGMNLVYDQTYYGEKNSKLRHTICGIKEMVKDEVVDSICSVINNLSKNAMESHMYEFHQNGTDTIDYVLKFNDKEDVEFDVKRTKSGDMSLCYCHTYWTERGKGTVADAIAERHWRINVHTMNTMRYGTRTVTPDFYLELRGDTLHSYLPYLGQARVSSTISPSIGLNFEESVLSYKTSIPKSKKYTQIDIDVRTREDKYHYVMELYDTGKAIIRVRSLNSDPISFDGTLSTELY